MPNPTVAFFDFDNTLVNGDSLWPFLIAVAGRQAASLAFLAAFLRMVFTRPKGDRRTFVKSYVLDRILTGKRLDDLAPAIEKVKKWITPREPGYSALLEHAAKGHHIVIVSGSLDVYLPALVESFPHSDLLCTEMEIVDGALTGRMASRNCVRTQKAERVAEYLRTHGPFEETWGYGNAPHDLPMLALLKRRVVV